MIFETKCLIIGSGVAGYTAGIYTGRAGLKPIIVSGNVGGQLATTGYVENYPGFISIKGAELTNKMHEQAEKCGAKVVMDFIESVDLNNRPFTAKSSSNEYKADTIIIATGAKAKWLGLESEEKYKGCGVSACAVCDGNFYRNKVVAVIGGGNSAFSEALYLSGIAKKVYLIHRNENFRAEKTLIDNVKKIKNIEIITNSVVNEIVGDEDAMGKFVTGVKLQDSKIINVDGVFIAIGHQPDTLLFKNQLKLTENGYIITDPSTKETSVKGVFACGDVQENNHKQAVVACGSACICALEAENFLRNLK